MEKYEVKLTTNKMAGFATVWSAESYESAWDEFLNQIELPEYFCLRLMKYKKFYCSVVQQVL